MAPREKAMRWEACRVFWAGASGLCGVGCGRGLWVWPKAKGTTRVTGRQGACGARGVRPTAHQLN